MSEVQHIHTDGAWFVIADANKCSNVYLYNINTKACLVISADNYVEYLAICDKSNMLAIVYRDNNVKIYSCVGSKLLYNWKVTSYPAAISFDKKGHVVCHFWKSYHTYSVQGTLLKKFTHNGDFQSATKSGCFIESKSKASFHSFENGNKKISNMEVVGDACETDKYIIARQFRGSIILLDHSSKIIKKIMTLGCFEERFVCAYIYDVKDTSFYRLWKYDIKTDKLDLIEIPEVGLTVFNNIKGVLLTDDLQMISHDGTIERLG